MSASRGYRAHRIRCRCGHLMTHHMTVTHVDQSANFRLEPRGPCELCGENVCRRFTPAGS